LLTLGKKNGGGRERKVSQLADVLLKVQKISAGLISSKLTGERVQKEKGRRRKVHSPLQL